MNNDFYIGWQEKASPQIGKGMRRVIFLILLVTLAAGIALAVSQRLIDVSTFEWGNLKTFSGTLQVAPYPHLLVPRPGNTDGQESFSCYLLVAQWKFGLKPQVINALDGKSVSLKGTLIYRGDQTMIEVVDGSMLADQKTPPSSLPEVIRLGQNTFSGEIVDSKCFLGVMNPGQLAPHRACAVRCISGGVPPILFVEQKDGPPLYLLLVGADGRTINGEILDFVARPIQITGEVERQGQLLILQADPSSFKLL
jgi:hypothetical protein